MCGFYEGSVDQIEGKNAWKIKKCRKNLAVSKISRIFAAVLQEVLNETSDGCNNASLAQLARARDL